MAKLSIYEEMVEEIAERIVEGALDGYIYEGKTLREWIDLLKQQKPCEDAISKQAVLNLPRKALKNYFGEVIAEVIYVRDVMELPPVTPQQKMGHWIFKNDNIAIPTGYFQCSECNSGKLLHVDNYCPSCGAQMESVERAESEDNR